MRERQLNSVVLPAPLGPMSPTICPSPTSNATLSRATMPPNRTVRSRTARIVRDLGTPTRMGRQPPLPEVFLFASVLADPPAEHEEEIAQPVEVAQRPLRDRLHARERQQVALGTPAHRAGLVQEAVHAAAAGQDERLEGFEVLLTFIHDVLELRHFALAHPEHTVIDGVGRRGQLAAEVEELVLDLLQDAVEPAHGSVVRHA